MIERERTPRAQPKISYAEAEDAEGERLSVCLVWLPACHKTQDCGGSCVLAANHETPCECAGDEPGCPGTCPA